jgi:hypothetical protein
MVSSSSSLKPAGARRSRLSSVRVTSAWLRAGRAAEPAKITSSMPSPRITLGRFSPITQRSASSRFDLPQPFGPTTPVRPGWMMSSVGSTKLLKPSRRRRVKCTGWGLGVDGRPDSRSGRDLSIGFIYLWRQLSAKTLHLDT